MQKKTAPVVGLYPTPAIILGAFVNEKPTWTTIAHTGILGYGYITAAVGIPHFINKGIQEQKAASVHMFDQAMAKKASLAGCNSGNTVDKSELFDWRRGDTNVPVINDAPVVMECSLYDIYPTKNFYNYIFEIRHTWVREDCLTPRKRIDYSRFKPVLFEMPTASFVETGKVLGNAFVRQ